MVIFWFVIVARREYVVGGESKLNAELGSFIMGKHGNELNAGLIVDRRSIELNVSSNCTGFMGWFESNARIKPGLDYGHLESNVGAKCSQHTR
jgi:hypothetical protein